MRRGLGSPRGGEKDRQACYYKEIGAKTWGLTPGEARHRAGGMDGGTPGVLHQPDSYRGGVLAWGCPDKSRTGADAAFLLFGAGQPLAPCWVCRFRYVLNTRLWPRAGLSPAAASLRCTGCIPPSEGCRPARGCAACGPAGLARHHAGALPAPCSVALSLCWWHWLLLARTWETSELAVAALCSMPCEQLR